jgi:hypothetical protein
MNTETFKRFCNPARERRHGLRCNVSNVDGARCFLAMGHPGQHRTIDVSPNGDVTIMSFLSEAGIELALLKMGT